MFAARLVRGRLGPGRAAWPEDMIRTSVRYMWLTSKVLKGHLSKGFPRSYMDGQWESDDVERLVYELLRIEDQTKDQRWGMIKAVAAIRDLISMYVLCMLNYFYSFFFLCEGDTDLK